MRRRKHPVSTHAIRREIRKALKKLHAKKKKKVPPEQREAIDLEIKVLEVCDCIADIWEC